MLKLPELNRLSTNKYEVHLKLVWYILEFQMIRHSEFQITWSASGYL